MNVERIIAELRRQSLQRKQTYTLTVKPRGSESIHAQRTKVHSGFLELEVDLYTLGEDPAVDPPSGMRTHFVPFDAIDWVLPTWH